jgi:hypothetical protein
MRTIGNGVIRRHGAGVSYGSGANIRQLTDWHLATTDDVAAVETAGFFDDLAADMKVGDLIEGRLDLGDTPVTRKWIVSANTGTAVTITRAFDDQVYGGGARAVVPTNDGLGNGLILPTDRFVEATSPNADFILTLPTASAATRGRVIEIWVVPATNCELRTPAASNQTINGVDSDGTQEALLAHTHLYRLTQHLATGWLMEKLTALGAVATAVVPD